MVEHAGKIISFNIEFGNLLDKKAFRPENELVDTVKAEELKSMGERANFAWSPEGYMIRVEDDGEICWYLGRRLDKPNPTNVKDGFQSLSRHYGSGFVEFIDLFGMKSLFKEIEKRSLMKLFGLNQLEQE